jgi:hypothetical protein
LAILEDYYGKLKFRGDTNENQKITVL